jgi:hypothetical protein
MPTPYGLVSTSQNLVEHQLTLTQPNQVIWYSLEPKNVNDFMSFDDDRNHLHVAVTNTLRFGPNPELADAWFTRGDIDIEKILRIVLKSVGPVRTKIAEANAPTEIAQIPLVIEDIMANSFESKHVDDENSRCGRSQRADEPPGS